MTCRPFEIKDADGNVVGGGFVCSRGERRKQCKFCGLRPATKLCDRELAGAKAGKTCDAPCCDACAVSIGPDKDLCPPHARERHKRRTEAREWLEGQKAFDAAIEHVEATQPPADATPEDLDEVDRGALAKMFRVWDVDPAGYEGDEVRASVRASVPRVRTGEDLPGSWHQQLNGGTRKWAVAAGEIPPSGDVPWDSSGVASNQAEMVRADREQLERELAEREAQRVRAAHSTPISEKVRHVKSQGQTRAHGCHWPGCRKQVPPAMWGCKEHWYALPKRLRDKIWNAYRPGQEATMTPSREYLVVAQEVEAWIRSQFTAEHTHEPEGGTAFERAARRARERDAARRK